MAYRAVTSLQPILWSNASAYLTWARAHANLTVVSNAAPATSLLAGLTALELHDVRVNPFVLTKNSKKKRHVPDDELYNADGELRRRVARGNTVATYEWLGEQRCILALQGMRKFTGKSNFDDDDTAPRAIDSDVDSPRDIAASVSVPAAASVASAAGAAVTAASSAQDDDAWQRYFLSPVASATHVVWTEKANGEAAHLAVLPTDGTASVLLLGSKNVHIAVRRDHLAADLESYQSNPRFETAVQVGRGVLALAETAPQGFTYLLSRLAATPGLTANFELLQPHYEHVVSYGLTSNSLRFFAFTLPTAGGADVPLTSLCAAPVDVALHEVASHGVPTVTFQTHPVDELLDLVARERDRDDREGAVVYFLDRQQNCIGLWKLKTAFYVLLRATREKVRRGKGTLVPQRLQEINTWLKLPAPQFATWVQRLVTFSAWVVRTNVSDDELRDRFATCWERFCATQPK